VKWAVPCDSSSESGKKKNHTPEKELEKLSMGSREKRLRETPNLSIRGNRVIHTLYYILYTIFIPYSFNSRMHRAGKRE
jgi:hypothetical protein